MKKYMIIIAILWGFTVTAQKQADTEVCCFAKVEFKQGLVWVFIPDLSYNIKLLPQPQKGLMVNSSLVGPFCHSNKDFQAEIDRIKQNILNNDINKLDQHQQEIYLKQLLMAIIWPHFFEMKSSVIDSKLKNLESIITKENKNSLNTVINLHQRVISNETKK